MEGAFASREACYEALAPLILLQDVASWILLISGAALVVVIIIHLFLRGSSEAFYYFFVVAVLLVGFGVMGFALTGSLPALGSFSTSEAKIENLKLTTTWRAGCGAIANAKAEVDKPSTQTNQETIATASTKGLDDPSFRDTFIWVFYSDARRPEGHKIRAAFDEHAIVGFTGEDNFAAVRVDKTPGTTRLLYSTPEYEAEARAFAEAIKPLLQGDIIIDGPYPNMTKKPLQLLMF